VEGTLDALYLHYFNRGVNKTAIIFGEENYSYLINLLYRFLPLYKIELVAFCLMPNHYHILLEEFEKNHASRFIQRVFNAFTQAVNHRYSRVGTLFQGSVKHTEIPSLGDLAQVVGYIHHNPVAARLVKHASQWKYSDFNEWAGNTCSSRKVMQYREMLFGSLKDYVDFVENLTDEP
jgi:putative transposase